MAGEDRLLAAGLAPLPDGVRGPAASSSDPSSIDAGNSAENPDQDHRAEEVARAGAYALLAALLACPPDARLIDVLRGIPEDVAPENGSREHAGRTAGAGPVTALGAAWQRLRRAGEAADTARLDDEYHALFIGVGRGELVPYGSWYITGFMMDKPLARLREDLQALGFERQSGASEPEDHVAALLEVMGLLVGEDEPIAVQRQFFDRHLAPWLGPFFDDLSKAGSADFYREVAAFGQAFAAFERQNLNMPE